MHLSDLDLTKFRKMLCEKHNQLKEMIDATHEAAEPVELDQQVQGRLRMDALQGQAMAKETLRRREIELHKIESVLKRLDEGDFGYCLSCEEMIAEKRLELDPANVICISCAEKGQN